MKILARFQGRPVEIVETYMSMAFGVAARIRALDGKPFTYQSHGGPYQSEYTTVPLGALQDLALFPEVAMRPQAVQL
jgi:hypothetical protein